MDDIDVRITSLTLSLCLFLIAGVDIDVDALVRSVSQLPYKKTISMLQKLYQITVNGLSINFLY